MITTDHFSWLDWWEWFSERHKPMIIRQFSYKMMEKDIEFKRNEVIDLSRRVKQLERMA